MRTGKLTLAILVILGLAVAANAMDKEEAMHGPTGYVPESYSPALVVGQDCTQPIIIPGLPFSATGQTNCGMANTYSNTCLGSYDGGEDVIYRLDIASYTYVTISMNPGTTTYTGILIDSSCPPNSTTCIAKATNSGASPYSIANVGLAAGTYYIMADTWPTPNCIPSFSLDIAVVPPPPPACDVVETLLCQDGNLSGTTCGGQAFTTDEGACDTYNHPGLEDWYEITLNPNGSFSATVTLAGVDGALLVMDECERPFGCLAYADATVANQAETISYTNTSGAVKTVYLVIDSYTTSPNCGSYTGTFTCSGGVVASEAMSFGAVKALYR